MRFTGRVVDRRASDALAAAIDLRRLRLAACPLCLFGVACELEAGDENEIRKALRFFAPLVWEEGLAEPLVAALEGAQQAGLPGADAAIADADARGPHSPIAEAVVRRLASEQLAEMERNRTASLN